MTLQLKFPPDYVLDRMEMYEIKSLMKYQHYAHKDEWEQARLIAYLVAQSNSTKKLKMSDIIEFPWDNQSSEKNTEITNADLERLKIKAQNYINNNQ